jgi:hypothetical protein
MAEAVSVCKESILIGCRESVSNRGMQERSCACCATRITARQQRRNMPFIPPLAPDGEPTVSPQSGYVGEAEKLPNTSSLRSACPEGHRVAKDNSIWPFLLRLAESRFHSAGAAKVEISECPGHLSRAGVAQTYKPVIPSPPNDGRKGCTAPCQKFPPTPTKTRSTRFRLSTSTIYPPCHALH